MKKKKLIYVKITYLSKMIEEKQCRWWFFKLAILYDGKNKDIEKDKEEETSRLNYEVVYQLVWIFLNQRNGTKGFSDDNHPN